MSLLALPIENKVHQRMHGVSSPKRLKWPDFSRTILLQGINVRQFIHARAARLFCVRGHDIEDLFGEREDKPSIFI